MAIIDFFDRGRSLGGHTTEFAIDGQSWSFDEAYGVSCQIARALLQLGLPKETKGAVMAGNHPLAFGLWRAGLTCVPVNPRGAPQENLAMLEAFDAEFFFSKRCSPRSPTWSGRAAPN